MISHDAIRYSRIEHHWEQDKKGLNIPCTIADHTLFNRWLHPVQS